MNPRGSPGKPGDPLLFSVYLLVMFGQVGTEERGEPLVCDNCGATEGVQLEDSRTMRATEVRTRWARLLEPDPPDPNAPIPYCRPCAQLHHEFWDAQWAEYRSSQGY